MPDPAISRRCTFVSSIVAAAVHLGIAASAAAEPASGGFADMPAAAGVAEILAQERAALKGAGAARLETLATAASAYPVRAAQRRGVTLATRGADASAAVVTSAKLDLATLDALPPAAGDGQWECLAEAIYFESRGEPVAGQVAVAEVILNRVDDPRYPDTVCGVTKQGVGTGRACQFSYACDGRPEIMTERRARDRAEKLAALMLGGLARTVSGGAIYFHTTAVRPGWARRMARTAAIGNHIFYRPGGRVASR